MKWEQMNKDLQGCAPVKKVNPSIRLESYYKTGRDLLNVANHYGDGGNDEFVYVHLLRFVHLVLNTLPEHPSYNHALFSDQKKEFRNLASDALGNLEILKERLMKKYDVPSPPPSPPKSVEEESEESFIEPIENRSPAASEIKIAQPSAPDLESSDSEADADANLDNLRIGSLPRTSSHHAQSRSIVSLTPGLGLFRRVLVPQQCPGEFMKLADANTKMDIETCGILAGVLEGNDLVVTHVILPKQTGSANTVVAQDDMDLVTFQIENNLMTLGWIHTHPSQSCFLSSVDLHNQYGYQCQLEEAIAIVMAPQAKPSMGTFTVTEKGMSVLSNCSRSGFHQHSENEGIYHQADHHSFVSKGTISMVDLRH